MAGFSRRIQDLPGPAPGGQLVPVVFVSSRTTGAACHYFRSILACGLAGSFNKPRGRQT